MTPEELAAIRYDSLSASPRWEAHILTLCDALEAAWAERDAANEAREIVSGWHLEAYARAERAEAERDEAIGNAVSNYNDAEYWRKRAKRAEERHRAAREWIADLNIERNSLAAALARVERAALKLSDSDYRKIRAAIEGDTR